MSEFESQRPCHIQGGNMTVEQLSNILSVLPPENEVMIEYQPRADEYQTEAICGVRTSDNLTVILGVTELV